MKIPKQYNLGMYPGWIIDTYQRVSIVTAAVQFFVTLSTLYVVAGREFIGQYINISYPVFIGIAVLLLIVSMVLWWVFIVPSQVAYGNAQAWKHQNPFRQEMKEIKDELSDLRKAVKRGKRHNRLSILRRMPYR